MEGGGMNICIAGYSFSCSLGYLTLLKINLQNLYRSYSPGRKNVVTRGMYMPYI